MTLIPVPVLEPVPFDPGTGPVPGYYAGLCGHRVSQQEWKAGFLTCERCPDDTGLIKQIRHHMIRYAQQTRLLDELTQLPDGGSPRTTAETVRLADEVRDILCREGCTSCPADCTGCTVDGYCDCYDHADGDS